MAETRHNIPPEFLDAADAFVQLANKYTDTYSRDWVRAAMMYATARFNAFAWITREDNLEQSLDAAVAYYASEYDKMLRDNVDEIEPQYRAARRAQSQ
jgi:LPS sulfotransferase NodH